MIKTLKLNNDNDFDPVTLGKDIYVYGRDATAQLVTRRLNLWKRSWFLDTEEGADWIKWANTLPIDNQMIKAEFTQRVLDTQGVKRILSYNYEYDRRTRHHQIKCVYTSIYSDYETALAAKLAAGDSDNFGSKFTYSPVYTPITLIWQLDISRLGVDNFTG